MVVAVLLLAGGYVDAATHYVDPAGDDAGPGTVAAPWQTIQHAAATLVAGDTVIVQPGVYWETVSVAASGASGMPIIYQGMAGAVLVTPDPTASLSAFDVQAGVGYVVVDGFEARGGYHETVFVRAGAHDISIRNCDLHDNRVGVWLDSVANVEVAGCQIHNNTSLGLRISGSSQFVTVRNTLSSNNDDGLGCSGGADGFSVEGTAADITFIDSQALANGQDGFDVQGDNIVVSGGASQGNTCTGIKVWQNARIENALVTGNTTGISTTSTNNLATSVDIVNSTVADNSGIQLYFKNANGAPPTPYSVLVRNVITYGPGKAIEVVDAVLLTEDHNILFRDDTTSGVLVVHQGGGTIVRYSGQKINTGLWTADSGQGVGTWAIAPDFVAPGSYQVVADSVVIDSGDSTAAPAQDRSGIARPQGNQFDIGPDEAPAAVNNHRPWADPGPTRNSVEGSSVPFTAYGSVDPDGNALTYSWDFGDGSATQTGYAVSHVFALAGTYTVTLTASDGSLSRSRSALVIVAPAPTPTPTGTPVPAGGSLGSPTPTPTPLHDSVVRAVRPVKVTIRRGVTSVTKRFRVVVVNADVMPQREVPGHVIQLVADEGTCPSGTLAGAPNFARGTDPPQDWALVKGGRRAVALVDLVINSDAFSSPGGRAPARCTMRFTAVGPGTDPTPENNVVDVELDVKDRNDGNASLVPDSAIRSVVPSAVRLRRGRLTLQRSVPVRVTDTDPAGVAAKSTYTVTVTVSDGTCPPGLVAGVDLDPRTPGLQSSATLPAGRSVSGKILLQVDAAASTSTNAFSPIRCVAQVSISTAGDAMPADNASHFVIDVVDANDF